MRKILMSSVASMALLGVAVGFGGPLLAQTDAPAAGMQTEGAVVPEEMRYRSIEGADAGSITLPDEMTTEEIVGANVYDANDEAIGEVVDLLVAEDGQVSQVLVDVGGFLGMGEHRVALDLDEIEFINADGVLRASVDVTEDQLEAMPAFERADDHYWVAAPMGSPVMPATAPDQTQAAATEAPAVTDTEYRSWDQAGEADMMMGDMSAKDVLGSTVYGPDGDGIGEVADLQIGPDNKIQRLIVDVGGLLGMGVHTVALPADEMQMAAVDGEQRITVSATKEELEAMPSYDQDADGYWVMND